MRSKSCDGMTIGTKEAVVAHVAVDGRALKHRFMRAMYEKTGLSEFILLREIKKSIP